MRAWATLRVFGLGRDLAEEVAAETCAEVWRTFNLARGGGAFEGFVQGRFVEALRRATSPPTRAHQPRSAEDGGILAARAPAARLPTSFRVRNPRHHRAVALLYVEVGDAH